MSAFTHNLEEALERVAALSPAEQDVLATVIVAEIRDAQRWEELFRDGRSPALLERLAAEALAEDEADLTEPLDTLLEEEADAGPRASRPG